MRYKKILYCLIALAVIFLSLITGSYYLFATENGTRTLLHFAGKVYSDVHFQQISGQILGRLEIKNLNYHSEEVDINIGHLVLQNSLNLLPLKFVNHALIAENVSITPHFKKFKNNTKATKISLPITIEAYNIDLKKVVIKNDDNTIHLPDTLTRLKMTPKILSMVMFKQGDTEPFFNVYHDNKNANISLRLPIQKSNFELDYTANAKQFTLNGEITDKHGGSVKINGRGEGKTKANIELRANNLHLNDLLPTSLLKMKGTLTGKALINSQNSQPILSAEFIGTNFVIGDYQIKNINTSALLDLNSKTTISSFFKISAGDIKFHQLFANHLQVDATGTLKKHTANIMIASKDINSQVILNGKYKKTGWQGKIEQFSIMNNKQKWFLENPTALFMDKKSISLGPMKFSGKDGKAVLRGHYAFNQSFNGILKLQDFDFSLLNFLMPEDMKIEGKLNLSAEVNSSKNKMLNINGDIKQGAVYYNLNNESQKTYFTGGKFTADMQKGNLNSNLTLDFPDGHLSSNITLPGFDKETDIKKKKIVGKINLKIANPKLLEVLIPFIKNIAGNINGSYILSGTISKPQVVGQLNLSQASFQIPKLNLVITNVNISATNTQGNISYNGSLTSGNGTLLIKGKGSLDKNGIPIDLDLQGSNILVCNQPEIKVYATPNMHLSLGMDNLKLSGKILIPEASLHPHDFGNTETASDDIVFIQPDGKKIENSSLKISSSIQLTLGNKISLNTRGIKGQVRGQIQIEDDPTKATVAYGQLWLQDGTYSVYGKTLQIDDGKLLFSGGPITNPGLNIRASRSIQATSNSLFSQDEKIKVGVSVTGTLKEPKINLFSEPPGRSSEDILSLLLLGIPINSLNNSVSQSNTQLLLRAADALNLSGNNKLLNLKDKVKKGLGLSELDIGTRSELNTTTNETIQHTAFVLGKYLSPKFYVNYSLDLFDHTNTLKVRYFLNKFWTIQSEANTNRSGIDILYTVER